MAFPPKMLPLLRDPVGLAPLDLDGDHLVNTATHRRYPIIDSIPVLLDPADLGPQNLKFQRAYDWMSHGYDLVQKVADLFYRGAITRGRRQFASKLSLKPGDRLLYTSIGTGEDLTYFAEHVPLDQIELVGLDLSRGMLRRCQSRLRPWPDTSLLLQANAERLPLADRSFDVVVHVGGINFFDHPATAVNEMLRVAKPGALIQIADETKDVVNNVYQRNPITRASFKDTPTDFTPRDWVPPGVTDPTYEELWNGKMYILAFKAPVH
ncbi:MAG TPA: methyltransferase domain-containing protein [Verrucomicrobiae bacterium]|nr:methyltransferase domain-containing protein [Verrucomicrobiae bacterium]